MSFEDLVETARQRGASDLHLEAGMAPVLRVRGSLETVGSPVAADALQGMARQLLGDSGWSEFLSQKSADLSLTIRGVRCRINVLKTYRGVGMAVRLLLTFQATLERLNLHPDLRELVGRDRGLILLAGPTGCGKSSTMAALIQEINLSRARHIITIESPIEHNLRPHLSLIRQREVGRDTPSFEQALIDAMREDPDVLMVGEMRDAQTMRLTLNAAETGHLVLATVHSGTVGEALHRIVSAFPADGQDGVRAQLADALVAVICQRLTFRPDLKIRVPECEILFTNSATKATIREGRFAKIADVLQTGASDNMWTFTRYRSWLNSKTSWSIPDEHASELPAEHDEPAKAWPTKPTPSREPATPKWRAPEPVKPAKPRPPAQPLPPETVEVLEIEDADDDLDGLLDALKKT